MRFRVSPFIWKCHWSWETLSNGKETRPCIKKFISRRAGYLCFYFVLVLMELCMLIFCSRVPHWTAESHHLAGRSFSLSFLKVCWKSHEMQWWSGSVWLHQSFAKIVLLYPYKIAKGYDSDRHATKVTGPLLPRKRILWSEEGATLKARAPPSLLTLSLYLKTHCIHRIIHVSMEKPVAYSQFMR